MKSLLLRLLHYSYLMTLRFSLWVVDVKWFFSRKEKKKRVAALPYVPEKFPGGDIRIANWKGVLKERGIDFDVFWVADKEEYESSVQKGLEPKNYIFHFKVLFRRIRILNKLRNYKVVWLQRNYIPMYPLKSPFFEKRLVQAGVSLVVDYYDADYVHNRKLVDETAQIASKISVSSPFLLSYFSKINENTYLLPLTLDASEYIVNSGNNKSKIIVGWMGSPGNSVELEKIKDALIEVEAKCNNVLFEFLCRKKVDLSLERCQNRNWNESKFNYHEWLSKIDVGVVPLSGDNDTSLAKSPMKLLEFFCSGVATVCSPCGAYPNLSSGENCLIASSKEDWVNHLELLITNEKERARIGANGLSYFHNFHSYKKNVSILVKLFDVN